MTIQTRKGPQVKTVSVKVSEAIDLCTSEYGVNLEIPLNSRRPNELTTISQVNSFFLNEHINKDGDEGSWSGNFTSESDQIVEFTHVFFEANATRCGIVGEYHFSLRVRANPQKRDLIAEANFYIQTIMDLCDGVGDLELINLQSSFFDNDGTTTRVHIVNDTYVTTISELSTWYTYLENFRTALFNAIYQCQVAAGVEFVPTDPDALFNQEFGNGENSKKCTGVVANIIDTYQMVDFFPGGSPYNSNMQTFNESFDRVAGAYNEITSKINAASEALEAAGDCEFVLNLVVPINLDIGFIIDHYVNQYRSLPGYQGKCKMRSYPMTTSEAALNSCIEVDASGVGESRVYPKMAILLILY